MIQHVLAEVRPPACFEPDVPRGARRFPRWWAIALTMAAFMSACSAAPGDRPADRQRLLVSAAASLTDAFDEIATAFEREHADIDVSLNLAGSSALREQILEGAPADVFASADLSTMQQLVAAGLVSGEPQTFVRNSMQLAVPAGNPAGITGLHDLARPELLIGLCSPVVPCGRLAHQVLDRAGVAAQVDTNEPDVRALLTKIVEGELDVGMTYVSDVVAAAGEADGVHIPLGENVITEYPIAVLSRSQSPAAAQAFVAFVLSPPAQTILAAHGFDAP